MMTIYATFFDLFLFSILLIITTKIYRKIPCLFSTTQLTVHKVIINPLMTVGKKGHTYLNKSAAKR